MSKEFDIAFVATLKLLGCDRDGLDALARGCSESAAAFAESAESGNATERARRLAAALAAIKRDLVARSLA